MKDKLEKLCIKYNLGCIEKEPELVIGGLMHKMYRVSTTQGEYAIKQLNPNIMKRPTALRNMINSEIVASALQDTISLVAAKNFDGKNVIESDGFYYMIFDWLEGKSIFAKDILPYHCEQIGRILGKIHASDINVVGMERNEDSRDLFDWDLLLEKAKQQNEECYMILKESLSDIKRWDNGVVDSWKEIAKKQVISHCDLDPKNVMWQDNLPYIIDWESAGFVNPYQELIEVLNYWITDDTGKYNKEKFDALMQAYTESVNICGVNWEVVLNCSFDGMLGWLEYSVKRALGLEGSGEKERQEGIKQTKGTICELRKYEVQMAMLKSWIDEYSASKMYQKIICPNCGALTREQISLYNDKLRKQNFEHTPILPTCNKCHAIVDISHLCAGGNIIVLTGTCGSGKSTIAELMERKGFVAIDGDCAIQSAKYKRSGEKVDYRELIDEIASEIDIISLYSKDMVLATVIHPEDIVKYKKMFEARNLKYRFILLKPSYETVLQRCQTRTCHKNVTPEYWINYFYNLLVFNDEIAVVDSSNMTAEETVEYIVKNYI